VHFPENGIGIFSTALCDISRHVIRSEESVRTSQRAQNTGLAYSCSVRSGGQLARPPTCRRVAFHTSADDLSVRSSRRYLEGCARFERSREWAHPAIYYHRVDRRTAAKGKGNARTSNSTSRFNGIRSGFRRSLAGGERRFVLQLGSSAPSCKMVLRRGERLGPDIA
jgi:hypothetical protein